MRWAGAPSAELARLVRDVSCEEPGDNPALKKKKTGVLHISEVASKSDTNNNSQQILLNKCSLRLRVTDFKSLCSI